VVSLLGLMLGGSMSHLLSSLAILNINSNNNQDYIENFIPFIAECLRLSPQDEVSLPQLQEMVLASFGLHIPQGALKVILTRAARKGFVHSENKVYYRNVEALSKFVFVKDRNEVLRKYSDLIAKLINFAQTNYNVVWNEEAAENALINFLDNYSESLLASAIDGNPIPEVAVGVQEKYIVRSFIVFVFEYDSVGFSALEIMVKGAMLANSLLYPDLTAVKQKFERVDFYFDTKFLLRALGLAGSVQRDYARELLQLLYESHANLRCFAHTVTEMQGILEASKSALRNKNTRVKEVTEYLLSSGKSAADVEMIISTLENRIQSLRIEIRRKPLYVEKFGIDEVGLGNTLQRALGYHNEDAKQHDVDSVAAIYRLRDGEFPLRLETARAVFVTTNGDLARVANSFFRQNYRDFMVPLCLSDYVLTTLAWLKKPTAAPALPNKRIIADAYAALNPPDNLWRMYLQEIGRLHENKDIMPEDYHLLRLSTQSKRLLMDMTVGVANEFSEGMPLEILNRAKENLRADVEASLHTEKESRRLAENRVVELEEKLYAEQTNTIARINYISVKVGNIASKILIALLVILYVLGLYFSIPLPLPRFTAGYQSLFQH